MPWIARDTLVFAAGTQGTRFDWRSGEEPGKISHEVYGISGQLALRGILGLLFYCRQGCILFSFEYDKILGIV